MVAEARRLFGVVWLCSPPFPCEIYIPHTLVIGNILFDEAGSLSVFWGGGERERDQFDLDKQDQGSKRASVHYSGLTVRGHVLWG